MVFLPTLSRAPVITCEIQLWFKVLGEKGEAGESGTLTYTRVGDVI